MAAVGTIYQCADECFNVLDEYLSQPDAHFRNLAEQLRARMALWDKYSGARAIPGYRLDDRLEGFAPISSAIISLLKVISGNIGASLSAVEHRFEVGPLESDTNPVDRDDIQGLSIEQTFQVIGDKSWTEVALSIKELLSLTRVIRESSYAGRETHVPSHYQPSDTDAFERMCQALLSCRFPGARSSLTEQLSKAMAIRRNRLLYRRDHEEKIRSPSNDLPTSVGHQQSEDPSRKKILAPDIGSHISRDKGHPASHPDSRFRNPEPTLLSKPGKSLALRVKHQRTMTTSITVHSARQEDDILAMYPQQPPPNQHSTCPYCFRPLDLPLSDVRWRAHIDKDLQVYVCLSEQCVEPVKFFDTPSAWLQHMSTAHGSDWTSNVHLGQWYCNQDHPTPLENTFTSSVKFESHLAEAHGFERKRIDLFKRRKRERATPREVGCCPLCESIPRLPSKDFSAESLEKHIAGHLQSLALFSLPALPQDFEEAQSATVLSSATESDKDLSEHGKSTVRTQDLDPAHPVFQPVASGEVEPSSEHMNDPGRAEIADLDAQNAQFLMTLARYKTAAGTDDDFDLVQAFAAATSTNILSSAPRISEKASGRSLQRTHRALNVIKFLHFIKDPSPQRQSLLEAVFELHRRTDMDLSADEDLYGPTLILALNILELEHNYLRRRQVRPHYRHGAFLPSNRSSVPDWPAKESLLLRLLTQDHVQKTISVEDWLSPTDPSMDLPDTLTVQDDASGSWLLADQSFKEWEEGDIEDLWLHGLAGTGKSFLSSLVAQHLKKKSRSYHVVLSFYFDIRNPGKQTLDAMLRSLIFQLYQHHPDTRPLTELLLASSKNGEEQPSTESLATVLYETIMLASDIGVQAILVLDALDECTTMDSLLEWLQVQSRFLATSRPRSRIAAFMRERSGTKEINMHEIYAMYEVDQLVPANYYVPFSLEGIPMSDVFLSRDSEMQQLEAFFRTSPENAISRSVRQRTFVIYGLGGVGKTQLCVQFVRVHSKNFSAILWLDGSSKDSLRHSLANAARKLPAAYRPPAEADVAQAVKIVQQWLSHPENTNWLLVLDSVDRDWQASSPDSEAYNYKSFLPMTDHGNILLTTRLSRLQISGASIHLQSVDNDCARKILERWADKPLPDAEKLLDKLGGLPLALAQAGAYIRQTGLSAQSYLQHYTKTWARLMAAQDRFLLQEYTERSLLMTWKVSYDQVDNVKPEAARLLDQWAFLYGGDVWYDLVAHPNGDELDFLDRLSILLQYSLVNRDLDSGRFSISPVVQEWCLYNIESKQGRTHLCGRAIGFVASMVPGGSSIEEMATSRRLLPQAKAVATRYLEMDESQTLIGEIFEPLHRVADFLSVWEISPAVEGLYVHALRGKVEALGPDHPPTLDTVNNLGCLYQNQGKLEQAEEMYQRALRGRERALGPDHPSTLDTVNNLGCLYQDQGKLEQAEEMYQRALRGRERALGPDRPSTLDTVNNLGCLYQDQGKLEQAEEMYQRALRGRERELGPDYPSTLDTVNNLGRLYQDQGKLEQAGEMYERALREYMRSGGDHQDVIQNLRDRIDAIGKRTASY